PTSRYVTDPTLRSSLTARTPPSTALRRRRTPCHRTTCLTVATSGRIVRRSLAGSQACCSEAADDRSSGRRSGLALARDPPPHEQERDANGEGNCREPQSEVVRHRGAEGSRHGD